MSRHWLLIPDLFPDTVVFFHYKVDDRAPGRSWRIRDYSSGSEEVHCPDDFDCAYSDSQILGLAHWEAGAPTTKVTDPYWVSETRRLNAEHAAKLGAKAAGALRPALRAQAGVPAARVSAPANTAPTVIPILDEAALRQRRSGKALDRMLTSTNSEDWVTWTVFRTLERQPRWFPSLLQVAGLTDVAVTPQPVVAMWRSAPSPKAYERASRARMAASSDPLHQLRAGDPKPVESNTEVDIAIEGATFLWFLEAKLHSDLSASTTYDPTRNQLVRNIDVLLEQARGRRALMSLVVLDERADRLHTQLVAQYRADPGALLTMLPHRSRAAIDAVVRDLTVIRWSGLLPLLGNFEPAAVRAELWRRCGGAPLLSRLEHP